MIKFIKDHLKTIVIFSFFYVYVLFIGVVPTNYTVTAPGGLTPLDEVFVIEGYEMTDQFYSVYVYSYDPITAFQYMLLKNDDQFSITKPTIRETENTIVDAYIQGQLSKSVSYQIALIKAYELAHQYDDSIYMNYQFEGLYIYDFPKRLDQVDIGDIVIEINGVSYLDFEPDTFFGLSEHRDVTYLIEKADGRTYTLDYTYEPDDLSFIFYTNYVIYDHFPDYELPGLDSSVGGPSGGMLQTLSLYVSLLKLNITDVKIAGTGTISLDGTIGRIGGITQKIYTAEYNDVDVFFIPLSHYDEISHIEISYDLVPVETIEEAALWLYEHFA